MVKKKTKSTQRRSNGPTVRIIKTPTKGLDTPAMEYAKLLHDPCSARVVHPVYAGGDAGFLFRAESFTTYGAAAGIGSGALHWIPGYMNANGTELLVMSSAAGGTTGTFAATSEAPGKTFLTNNAKGLRCVAACLKVSFPGAESARAGRVHVGMTSAGCIDNGAILSPDGVAQLLQHYGRTPTDTIELVWRPGHADQEFNDPSELASANIRDRKQALTVAWAGLPFNTGLTFHFTAVYEWSPGPGLGVANNVNGKSMSKNTLDDVIDYMVERGETWVRGLAHQAGNAAQGAVINLVSKAFGTVPALMRTRMGALR